MKVKYLMVASPGVRPLPWRRGLTIPPLRLEPLLFLQLAPQHPSLLANASRMMSPALVRMGQVASGPRPETSGQRTVPLDQWTREAGEVSRRGVHPLHYCPAALSSHPMQHHCSVARAGPLAGVDEAGALPAWAAL